MKRFTYIKSRFFKEIRKEWSLANPLRIFIRFSEEIIGLTLQVFRRKLLNEENGINLVSLWNAIFHHRNAQIQWFYVTSIDPNDSIKMLTKIKTRWWTKTEKRALRNYRLKVSVHVEIHIMTLKNNENRNNSRIFFSSNGFGFILKQFICL